VYEYDNLSGNNTPASVVGGYVYRGTAYPAMAGYYYATDVYSGNLYKINISNFSTSVQTGLPTLVAGFGETETGELLAASLNGIVYALAPATPTSVDDLNDAVKPKLYPTVITQKRFTLELPEAYTQLQIISINGVVMQQQNIRSMTGRMQVTLDNIPTGVYIVKLLHSQKVWAMKILIN
jgi:hypothetical protein